MEHFTIHARAASRCAGTRASAIIGVVASGNLEVLLERVGGDACDIEVATSAAGFRPIWEAVIADFVERASPGGLRISINDGGARPDTVSLRLMQGVRLISEAA
ncbi:malonate decarboxylase acyl carrier protein [Lichenicoccus sp.]|uniref:malonate decarboxylase acyl carrier protein n=1 Tax=Lichenicoccus sp. TaxID=2781899 RepID=UPI003D11C631